jgi:dTDP-3-amino-2,3,6-trideoxy-4-keto-D-glucose/dTDP-3-amino-3,4,6-trideoxy-alpha-D-glucose/dTDP-2,6-dideoxy-D-kanosamine transaminase
MSTNEMIPMNDLARGTRAMRTEIDRAVARVLDSGYFVLGPENAALEDELAAYVGVAGSVLVGNGTDALQLALAAVGVTSGDAVMTVANAGGYTSTAARALDARLVYVDIEPSDHLMSVRTLEAALASAGTAPRALVVTHLFGAAVDVAPVVELAHARGIAVVEDCAQALGTTIDGRKVGSFGDIATTSFYPTKNLGAIGDAGALFGSDAGMLERARRLRQYGWESKYRATVPGGMNSRMDELQAAIVRVKLPHLDSWNARRRAIHSRYEAAAAAGAARFVTHAVDGFAGHLAVLEVSERERARATLRSAGVGTDVHYPIPDHRQPLASGMPTVDLPVTDHAADHILSVPLFPELSADEIDRVEIALGSL